MYELAICAIFNQEYRYLPEWVDWHAAQGASHFFLYQHDPNPLNVEKISKKHAQLITLIDWRKDKSDLIQRRAYNHCLQRYAHTCKWLMVLDIDEFLMPADPKREHNALEVLRRHFTQDVAAIEIKVYNFGHKPHMEPPPIGSIIDCFRYVSNRGGWEKSMINGREAKKIQFISAHWISGGRKHKDKGKFFRINHYITKSVKEYKERGELWLRRKKQKNRGGFQFNTDNDRRFNFANAIRYSDRLDITGQIAKNEVHNKLTDFTYSNNL